MFRCVSRVQSALPICSQAENAEAKAHAEKNHDHDLKPEAAGSGTLQATNLSVTGKKSTFDSRRVSDVIADVEETILQVCVSHASCHTRNCVSEWQFGMPCPSYERAAV